MGDLVIVTGGSRGIGAATAILLASQGWSPCIGYRDRAEAAADVVDKCAAYGVDALAVRADIAVEPDVLNLFDTAETELGPVRGLVNNAGVVAGKSPVAELTADRITQMLAVNVLGAFLCAREAVRRMTAGGSIANISSRAARLGSPGEYVDYAAAKAAVDTMTVGLAREVAGQGIRVNAIRPGLVDTEIHASGGQPDRAHRLAETIPLGRPGKPTEIAEAVAWLLSDRASYTTGAILDVSGGR